ncbi:hypothetical protein K440DRAFT_643295 [Wilcoxina mikolae CBS 423.85]|nr:hypothetical protein K440DRAFT_643295 [Wilcoxina mikolae CBS 423.85]
MENQHVEIMRGEPVPCAIPDALQSAPSSVRSIYATQHSAQTWPPAAGPEYRRLVNSLPFVEVYRRLREDHFHTLKGTVEDLAASRALVHQATQIIGNLHRKIRDKEKQLQEATDTNTSLHYQLNKKNGEIQQLKSNVTDHKKKLAKSQDRLQKAKSTNRSLRKQHAEKDQEILKLEDSLEAKISTIHLFFIPLTNSYSIAMSTVASVEADVSEIAAVLTPDAYAPNIVVATTRNARTKRTT